MTSVVITDTPVSEYTWATALFDWTDVRAGKTWADAHVSSYAADVGEDVGVGEVLSKTATKHFSEAFAVADALVRVFGLNPHEALSVSESYVDWIQFILSVHETLSFSETLSKHAQKPFAESVAVSEHLTKSFDLNVLRAVGVSESFGRVVGYHVAIAEGLSVSEALAKASSLNVHEAIGMIDEYVRKANGVISDTLLETASALTLAQFSVMMGEQGGAPGFRNFRDFIPGDYDYRYAIFRAILESVGSDRPVVNRLEVSVDVPDVLDSGTATITDAGAGITVTFARTFHVAPEITLTLKGGTQIAIPKIIGSPTNTQFTAKLYDSATQAVVTGTFTWAAKAY